MLGLGEVGGSEAFSSRRPTRLGGIFSPDGRVSASSSDDVVDNDLDGDLGLGGVLSLFLLGEGDAVDLLRAGEQDGVVDLGRFEGLEQSSLYATFLLGDWGVLGRGDGDLWRLRAGDLGRLSRLQDDEDDDDVSLPVFLDENDADDIAESHLVSLLNSLSKDLALRLWELRVSSVTLIMWCMTLRSALTFSTVLVRSYPGIGAILLVHQCAN